MDKSKNKWIIVQVVFRHGTIVKHNTNDCRWGKLIWRTNSIFLQMQKLRPRESRDLSEGCLWQSWDLNQVIFDTFFQRLPSSPCYGCFMFLLSELMGRWTSPFLDLAPSPTFSFPSAPPSTPTPCPSSPNPEKL